MRIVLSLLLSCLGGLLIAAEPVTPRSVPSPVAALIDIEGPIGPATSLYFESASTKAADLNASLIILRIDTPGGLDQAMRDIIKRILSSDIPVVAYVTPSGARAASAGTYILYASHVAAMSPATNLGAATPVPIMGGSPESPAPPEDRKKSGKPAEKAAGEDTMKKKLVNDAVAYIRSLAEQRGRNADWAERAVREGASLSAEEAHKQRVIDIMATDTRDLLRQLDGRQVALTSTQVTLQTKGMAIEAIAPDWREKLLGVLTNPAVAYILMLIGIYGLLLEGYNPGSILPGVIGGICLLLALYAFQILPINYVGLGLMALGICLIVMETLLPSFGILGIGGIVAFVMGSIMLLDTDVPGYDIPLGIIAAIATAAGLLVLVTLSLLLRSRRKPVVSGHEAMLGAEAEVLEDFDSEGWVHVHGETWRALVQRPVKKGERLRVKAQTGLQLTLE
jgi:membrane-bound serine protease (ClpP class)